MALAEGTIRKDGQPAKKPGYKVKPANVGRPRRKTCAYPGCNKPPREREGTTGPFPQHCSVKHKRQADRDLHILRKYRITQEQYLELFKEQGGRCAICGTKDPKTPGRPRKDGVLVRGSFHIDHDHVTGKVRGLLCNLCNRGIGQLRDDPAIMRAAAEYVETHSPDRETG